MCAVGEDGMRWMPPYRAEEGPCQLCGEIAVLSDGGWCADCETKRGDDHMASVTAASKGDCNVRLQCTE